MATVAAIRRLPAVSHALLPILGVVTLVGGWTLATTFAVLPPNFLPSPVAVFERIIELTQRPYSGSLLQEHLIASLRKFAISYVLAVLTGVPLGLAMGRFRLLDWVALPLLEAFRFVPPIAWVPFSILWFGTGFLAPTFVIFAGSLFPCVVNSYRGARQVDRSLVEAAQMLGTGRWRSLCELFLPAALPQIVAGMRVSAGFGWQSLIGAELIVGSTGLGYMIVQGESNLDASVVVAGMVTIGVVGAIIDYSMLAVETRIRRNWGD